jgi:hypothetical protein
MDVNEAWEKHARTNCDPGKYDKKKVKVRCDAENCREILNSSNTVKCSSCHKNVCLRHRFKDDHQCKRQRQSFVSRPADTSNSSQIQDQLFSVGSSVGASMSKLVQSAKV